MSGARENSHAVESENLKSGDPPRPKTEPEGSKTGSDTKKTKTDPATGAPNH